jgi:PIN domain nuclease of toxin-antitoxin system
LIIWQCIKNGYALLSRDGHFDEYRKHGLVVIK